MKLLTGIFGFIIFSVTLLYSGLPNIYAQNSLEQYCTNGIYYLKDISCGRAPNCGGKSYNEANQIPWDSVDDCWNIRCSPGMCVGDVPLCCYELERTGDPMMCNWPERGYCHPAQCAKITPDKAAACNGGSGDCLCAHGIKYWCNTVCGHKADGSDIPYKSLQDRIGNPTPPTSTPTVTTTPTTSPPNPTTTPTESPTTPTITPSVTSAPSNPTLTPTRIPTLTITSSPTPTPTKYPTTGPALLPKIPPVPFPAGPYCPSFTNCTNKPKGDADCNGLINQTDYGIWKTQYDTYIPGSQTNPNADFACVEGNSNTYFADLIDFEVWRRNVPTAILPTANPTITPTVNQNAPTSTITPTTNPTRTPTATPTIAVTPTPTITPTPVSQACPQTSNNTYQTQTESLPNYTYYNPGDPPPNLHPDYNLQLRGYIGTDGSKELVNYNGPTAPLIPPQLMTLFRNRNIPEIVSLYKVYDWDWANNRKGSPITTWYVTLIGLKSTSGEKLYTPFSEYDISENPTDYLVFVIYADETRVTFKYDDWDTARSGFILHVEDICVDPNLLKMYNDKNYNNPANRTSLIALRAIDSFGTAKRNEVKVAIRADGSFMDPRSRKDWWQGY